jgi:transposase-like protein
MAHRIRFALKDDSFAEKLSGTIEADECYVPVGTQSESEGKCPTKHAMVFTMVQRGGEARSRVMPTVNGANLKQAVKDNVQVASTVYTDGHTRYHGLEEKFFHKSVKHCANEFIRREGENVVSTCAVESFFSLLKRGIIGTFHHVSAQHLPLYLAEFDHRHNCRKTHDND